MKKSSALLGLALVILGVLMLANNIAHWNLFSMGWLWPMFILIPGLIFEWGYFSNHQNPGLLVPGGILTTIGVLFFFEIITNWQWAEFTWPVYPLAVAIGLFQLYLFSGRPFGLLIPVFILTAVSLVSFSIMFINTLNSWVNLSLIFPCLLVLIGVVLIFHRSGPNSDDKS